MNHSSTLRRTLNLVRMGTILMALGLLQTTQAQTTWYVDDDAPGDPGPSNPFISDPLEDGSVARPFDTLRETLNLAQSGDTVLVEPGIYQELSTIELSGLNQFGSPAPPKALTIQSTMGPQFTIIDGAHLAGSASPIVLRAAQGESASSVFEGFTLRNADSGSLTSAIGAAIYLAGSSPTIRNCWIQNSQAYLGAGMYLNASLSLIQDCRFENNDSVHQGGAVYVNRGNPIFEDCTFEANQANFGGAVLTRSNGTSSGITIRGCTFLNNFSRTGYAGAFAKFDSGSCLLERSLFVGNVAMDQSGAIHISEGGTVSDCILNGNTSNANAGAINATGSGTVSLLGTTVTENIGGGVSQEFGALLFVTNSIVWNNQAFESALGVSIEYSDVRGGAAGSGNIDKNPRFVNPRGADLVRGTLDDDLRLRRGSPCIDAGDTSVLTVDYPLDFSGKSRVLNELTVQDSGVAIVGYSVDIGAHEYQSKLAPTF